MSYSFDQIINRKQTNSYKWDQNDKLFGDSDILPLWVADMDFASPPAVQRALLERVQHGVYGYTIKSDEVTQAIMRWMHRRHQWEISAHHLSFSPGIVTSLSLVVECFTSPGDAVIIQTPVYYPFYDVIRMNGRKVAANPLLLRNGHYEIDFVQLEQLMQQGSKLMLFCSPHNPGGRVWSREELIRLGQLALKYQVLLLSDEIHSDLVLPGHQHTPYASLSEAYAQQSITLHAPTKTFNLPGIPSSYSIISNHQIKRTFDTKIKALSLHMTHFFHDSMVCAAYDESEQWLDELMVYLQGNLDVAEELFSQHLPEVVLMKPEATYLLWVDCRKLGLDIPGLKELMFKQAKVAFSEGSVFGIEGEGYVRINLACPRAMLHEAITRFCKAASHLSKS